MFLCLLDLFYLSSCFRLLSHRTSLARERTLYLYTHRTRTTVPVQLKQEQVLSRTDSVPPYCCAPTNQAIERLKNKSCRKTIRSNIERPSRLRQQICIKRIATKRICASGLGGLRSSGWRQLRQAGCDKRIPNRSNEFIDLTKD